MPDTKLSQPTRFTSFFIFSARMLVLYQVGRIPIFSRSLRAGQETNDHTRKHHFFSLLNKPSTQFTLLFHSAPSSSNLSREKGNMVARIPKPVADKIMSSNWSTSDSTFQMEMDVLTRRTTTTTGICFYGLDSLFSTDCRRKTSLLAALPSRQLQNKAALLR